MHFGVKKAVQPLLEASASARQSSHTKQAAIRKICVHVTAVMPWYGLVWSNYTLYVRRMWCALQELQHRLGQAAESMKELEHLRREVSSSACGCQGVKAFKKQYHSAGTGPTVCSVAEEIRLF